jgi:predicted CXXCH cytochrome family protein
MLLLLLAWACTSTPEPAPTVVPAQHVGSSRCADCHPTEHAAWASSHHALAERAVGEALPGGTPTGLVPAGATPPEAVRLIGVDPLWQPLLRAEGGRLQASSLAWDVARGEWFDIFGDEDRQAGEWGHWTGRGMTWNAMCAQCHVTGLERRWTNATDSYDTRFTEPGLGCEACHGPGSLHAADPSQPLPGPADRESMAQTCEGCHVRWSPITDAHVPGQPLLDHGIPVLPGMDPGWFPDGQVLAENFEAVAFRQSRMHEAGVRCVDCHEPHTAELVRQGDALCLGCHTGRPGFDPAHGHHEEATCVSCHMPVTTYMARHPRHDHGFTVPDAGLAATLGLPVACDRCHTVDAPLIATAEAWWPPRQDRRQRTELLARAWSGDPSACEPLAGLLSTAPPAWRAVIAIGLRGCAEAEPALLTASHDPDPWVRAAVASALPASPNGSQRLQALLADPIAAVRLQAARGLRDQRAPTDPSMRELLSTLESHADHAVTAADLGAWWSIHGRPDKALPHLERAARHDPHQPDVRRALAVVLSALGRHGEAARQLDEAVALNPQDADLAFSLGLAAAAAARPEDAVRAFEHALQVDPTHGRAAYNLGLLLHQLGRTDEALALLYRASGTLPDDAAPAYAASTILLQLGRKEEARAAATEALRRDPSHAGARQVIQQSAR